MRYLLHGEFCPLDGDSEEYGQGSATFYASNDLDSVIDAGGEHCLNIGELADPDRDEYKEIIRDLKRSGIARQETAWSNNSTMGYITIWDTEHPKVKKLKKIESEIEINTQGD